MKTNKVLMMGFTAPQEGGSERHIYEVSSRIKESTVLTQRGTSCKNKIEIPVINSPIFLRNVTFLIMCFFYSLYLAIKPKKEYEVIHLHENLLYFLVPILRIRYKVVVTVHGIKGFKFYDNKILWIVFRLPLLIASNIIAVNLEDKRLLDRELGRNTAYIPNGVNLSIYPKVKAAVENKIVFIGRVHEQKGIIYLLKAFDELGKEYPNFRLEIIGDINEYARELQKTFRNKNIIWAGYMSDREKIVKELKSAYCIALPSVWEGLPLTLFEAMASGRPVIVSDIPAFKSVLKNETLFFKSENTEELRKAMIFLIKNKKKADELGKKGAELSKEYDWANISLKTMSVYDIK